MGFNISESEINPHEEKVKNGTCTKIGGLCHFESEILTLGLSRRVSAWKRKLSRQ